MIVNYPAAVLLVALLVCEMALLRYFPDQKELITMVGTLIAALFPAVLSRKPPPPPSDSGSGEGPKAPNLTLIAGGLLAATGVACAASPVIPYGVQLEMCVANARTLAESQECRCRVNLAEGRACTPLPAHCRVIGDALSCNQLDAGADQ